MENADPAVSVDVSGYQHPLYAETLSEFGVPRELWRSGGWILERPLPLAQGRDGLGCYPLFCCREWAKLSRDVEDLADLVSVCLVADPFGDHTPALLAECFPDLLAPFKEHLVVDLSADPEHVLSAHHRRNTKKALARVGVERSAEPARWAGAWVHLYQQLITRHGIAGLSAFSPTALEAQLGVPGVLAFRAVLAGRTAGMILWMTHGRVAYYHLGAYSAEGYEAGASYALFRTAWDYFATTNVGWLDLGAGAGAEPTGTGGLERFKRGWATGTRTAYLCGRILDRDRYAGLTQHLPPTRYFPAYRAGEFR